MNRGLCRHLTGIPLLFRTVCFNQNTIMITFSEIQLLRGGKPLLEQASATIHPGDKIGLVGKNGCGKSTLFALLKDELSVDAGT